MRTTLLGFISFIFVRHGATAQQYIQQQYRRICTEVSHSECVHSVKVSCYKYTALYSHAWNEQSACHMLHHCTRLILDVLLFCREFTLRFVHCIACGTYVSVRSNT
jgi:hypothetical protein